MGHVDLTHPILGLLLACIGLVVQRRDRARTSRLYALSLYVGCVCLFFWPAQNSSLFDNAIHLPGFGRLITDLTATASVMLQFAFITTLADRWLAWRKGAVAVYVIGMIVLSGLWTYLHAAFGSSLAYLLYPGYAASPPAILIWNIVVGAAITYVSILGVFGYAYAVVTMPPYRLPRATTSVGVVVYSITTIYGLLVLGQLVASKTGLDPTGSGVLRFTGPIVLICVVFTLASTGYIVFGRSVATRTRAWFSLTHKQQAIDHALADLLNALATASDMRSFLGKYADRGFIQAVDVHCKAQGVSSYRCKCAREAARIILPLIGAPARTTNAVDIEEEPDESDEGPPDAEAGYQALLADLSRHVQEDVSFIADSNRIAVLVILDLRGTVIPDDRVPEIELRREPEGWRREVAKLIIEIVHARANKLADDVSGTNPGKPATDMMEPVR